MLKKRSLTSNCSDYRYFAAFATLATAGSAYGAILTDANHVPDFGWALGLADSGLVVGAPGGSTHTGTAYYYSGGTVLTLQKQHTDLVPGSDYFGYAVSASGGNALVGDFADKAGTPDIQVGAAYYYKDLGSVSGGAVTETLKLQASDGAANAYFGRAVSLSDDNALVGAFGHKFESPHRYVGEAYYFRSLNSATGDADGVVTETFRLTSDRAAEQDGYFGLSLSLSGDNALVAALRANSLIGEVYYYRDLPNAVVSGDGTVKETFVLQASDGNVGDEFGRIVSLDGNSAIVGADHHSGRRGAVYYYNDLDGKGAGTIVHETAKLLASDGEVNDEFGFHASLSGGNALVGARAHNSQVGAAYLFKDLEQAGANSTITETIILTASDGVAGDLFGSSVAINGNSIAIGANHAGKVYTGDIRTFTVLDDGNTELATAGLSFVSHEDWVIGATSSGNRVTVSRDSETSVADVANVTAAGKGIYIGQQAGANGNSLLVEGTLLADSIFVGAVGNSDNAIYFSSESVVDVVAIYLGYGNSIGLDGLSLDYEDLIEWLDLHGGIDLYAAQSIITRDNAAELLRISSVGNYTLYTVVPEPSTYALLLAIGCIGFALRRRQ